jgi:hypothetical protein
MEKNFKKSIINNIIYTLSTNLASAPPLPILGRPYVCKKWHKPDYLLVLKCKL